MLIMNKNSHEFQNYKLLVSRGGLDSLELVYLSNLDVWVPLKQPIKIWVRNNIWKKILWHFFSFKKIWKHKHSELIFQENIN